MGKYLVLWHRVSTAIPTDPEEHSKISKMIATSLDNWIKKGEIKEHGHFLDGASGYTIWEVEAEELLKNYTLFYPYYENEVHEIIPFKKSKEIVTPILMPEKKK